MSSGLSRRTMLRGAGTLGVGAVGLGAMQQTASAPVVPRLQVPDSLTSRT